MFESSDNASDGTLRFKCGGYKHSDSILEVWQVQPRFNQKMIDAIAAREPDCLEGEKCNLCTQYMIANLRAVSDLKLGIPPLHDLSVA